MAEVKFVLNSVVDIATSEEVHAAAAKTQSKVDELLGRIPSSDRGVRKRVPSASPRIPLGAAATGTFPLDFGSPPSDTVWWIQEVVVHAGSGVAADAFTAVAGAFAALYIGRPPAQLTSATIEVGTWSGLTDLQRVGIAVPGVFPFSGESVCVHDMESLYVVLFSPTTAVSVFGAVATVVEMPASAVLLNSIPWKA